MRYLRPLIGLSLVILACGSESSSSSEGSGGGGTGVGGGGATGGAAALGGATCGNGMVELGETCAVGLFPAGASPYGCLDMAGNVWQWTRSLWGIWSKGKFDPEYGYPYVPDDGREDMDVGDDGARVLRGASYYQRGSGARVSRRDRLSPNLRLGDGGFRIVVSPILRSAL